MMACTFKGSEHQMSQLYQDSMAIAKEFGPASYFITVTVNPNWQEIQSALLPGQAAHDHPDLVVHVFHRKLSCFSGISSLSLAIRWHVYMPLSIRNVVSLMPISYFGFQLNTSLTLLKTWTRFVLLVLLLILAYA